MGGGAHWPHPEIHETPAIINRVGAFRSRGSISGPELAE